MLEFSASRKLPPVENFLKWKIPQIQSQKSEKLISRKSKVKQLAKENKKSRFVIFQRPRLNRKGKKESLYELIKSAYKNKAWVYWQKLFWIYSVMGEELNNKLAQLEKCHLRTLDMKQSQMKNNMDRAMT